MAKEINWSEKRWKNLLIEQRKRMWLPDTIDKLAAWLHLTPGQKVADIGCGLGYLGFTFWPYFGKGGHYCGVDISEELVQEAGAMAQNWAVDGTAECMVGDAYHLDIPDNSFDVVMCQTLLMHLAEPAKALDEMKRIAKPGGIVLCIEPDNLTASTQASYNSSYEESIEEYLIRYKTFALGFKGKLKLGLGDHTIGTKLPQILFEAGLEDIAIRKNDRVDCTIPPYSEALLNFARQSGEVKLTKEQRKENKAWRAMMEREVLAGGGSTYLLRKYHSMMKKRQSIQMKAIIDQIDNERYFTCKGSMLYVAKGTKASS
jgi:ubiquinone/menaquinone biosynthesis C-methylase UbiE